MIRSIADWRWVGKDIHQPLKLRHRQLGDDCVDQNSIISHQFKDLKVFEWTFPNDNLPVRFIPVILKSLAGGAAKKWTRDFESLGREP